RALPHKHRRHAGANRRARGTRGLGPGHAFRLVGGIVGIYHAGTGYGAWPATARTKKRRVRKRSTCVELLLRRRVNIHETSIFPLRSRGGLAVPNKTNA